MYLKSIPSLVSAGYSTASLLSGEIEKFVKESVLFTAPGNNLGRHCTCPGHTQPLQHSALGCRDFNSFLFFTARGNNLGQHCPCLGHTQPLRHSTL